MQTLEKSEIWKDIPGYEGRYQASSLGRIKSLSRTVKTWNGHKSIPECVLKLRKRNGYLAWKNKSVHRLIALTFLTKPEHKDFVNHKNGSREDNRADNLEWVTLEENARHAWATGLCNHETREKMSLAARMRTGIRNTFFGKKHSSEAKTKMSLTKMKNKRKLNE